jgi:polysaccharide biosynthesis protein PslL
VGVERHTIDGRDGIAGSTRPRSALVDVGKGLGILLVVFGHNAWVADHLLWLDEVISTFRLPLFFFLAGVTFPAGRSIGETAWRRADALLKPFAVVVLVYALTHAARSDVTLESTLLSLTYATGFTLVWVPMWFLPHLWLASVAAAAYLRWGAPRLKHVAATAGALAAMAVAGAFVIHLFHNPVDDTACMHHTRFSAELLACGLPFSADVLLLSGFFFLAGQHLKRQVLALKPHPLWIALAAAIFAALWFGFHQTINLNFRSYGQGLIVPLQALAAIYLALALCHALGRWQAARGTLAHVGRSSLFILMFHSPLQAKSLAWMMQRHWPGALAMLLSYAAAVGLCMALWELVRRQPLLARLLLPMPQAGQFPPVPWARSTPP